MFVTACDSPADRDPAQFQPSQYVARAPWLTLVPLSELIGPDLAETEALQNDAAAMTIRAEALRARVRLASTEILTPEERAHLIAAAARWPGA